MKGDKLTTSTYLVRYTNKIGKRVNRRIKARTGDNAFLFVKRKLGGKNIKTNKLNK